MPRMGGQMGLAHTAPLPLPIDPASLRCHPQMQLFLWGSSGAPVHWDKT